MNVENKCYFDKKNNLKKKQLDFEQKYYIDLKVLNEYSEAVMINFVTEIMQRILIINTVN